MRCQSDAQSQAAGSTTESQATATATSRSPAPEASAGPPSKLIAVGAALFGVGLFAATRLLDSGPTLAVLEQQAIPLETALSNGKPTVVEFYASWCEVCRELAPEEYNVQQRFSDRVNFVMLNVENSRWAPELVDYGVNGIPHFVYLDERGTPLGAAVGRLPMQVLEGNTAALAKHEDLPYIRAQGATSSLQPPDRSTASQKQAAPRDHA